MFQFPIALSWTAPVELQAMVDHYAAREDDSWAEVPPECDDTCTCNLCVNDALDALAEEPPGDAANFTY